MPENRTQAHDNTSSPLTHSQNFWVYLYPNIDLRITLPFLLVIVITAVIAVFIVTSLTANTIQERLDNQLLDSAQIADESIVLVEQDYLAALRLMVFTEGVDDAILTANIEDIETALRGIVANERLDDVIVFDVNRQPLLRLSRSDFPPIGYTGNITLPVQLDWETAEQVLAGVIDTQGDKYVELVTYDDLTVAYFVAPVRDENNQIVGGIAAGISEQTFTRTLTNQVLSEVILYAEDQRLIASSFLDASALNSLPNTLGNRIFSLTEDDTSVVELTIDDTPYQIIFSNWDIRSNKFGVIGLALPTDFIQNRLSSSRNSFITLFAVLVVAIMIIGFVVAQSIIRPVFKMVQTTRAIRQGDLSRRVDLRMPDELGELGQSFDHMTDQLVRRNRKINSLYRRQLRETARRTAMLESISDMLIVVDDNYKIILMNNTAKGFIQTLKQHNDDTLSKQFWFIVKNPENYYKPVTIQMFDLDLSVLATAINMKDGQLLGHVMVLRDITSILEAERIKDEILLQLSHELRTPLAGARGFAELASMFDGEKQLTYIRRSTELLDVLGDMIDRVIEVSVLLSGKLYLDIITFDLVALLIDLIEDYADQIEASELALSVDIPFDELQIEGDDAKLREAISNVLQNAYKYTLEGGGIIITLRVVADDTVSVIISDTGVGIDDDEQERVFERMYRGRAADAGETDERGMGLGLFVTREFVQAHHGSVELDSQRGEGTALIINLPMTQPSVEESD